jgi:Mrp family chromosome partitioning ATPase
MMKGLEAQIADAEKQKQRLEKENPGLLAGKLEETRPLGPGAAPRELGPRLEYITQAAKVPALESRIRTLTNQLNAVHAQAVAMSDAEGAISDLELTRQMQETQYTYFQRALDELRADEQLGVVRNSNVIPIQTPSPPFLDKVKLLKVALVVLIGGLGCAFGLAFLSEFYLDQSLKRPSEVEARLRLPVFVAIPRLRLNRKGGRRELEAGPAPLLPEQTPSAADTSPPAPDAGSAAPGTPHSTAVALWNPHYAMRPFEDALRDRLITYFDLRNMTHKPKLVALTSCGEGSGVTTIATGLAASMSETGEGSVLLVDMNEDGSMHEFYRGNPSCGLEDALELEKRDTAMVRDNLYVVKEHGDGTKAPRSLPKHFQHLVPKLKASDYDYVIFDLPPISQVSVTSKLARFMDINLIVVEAEHTDREVVRRASAYLAETGASVGVVLNKRRSYGPRRLQQDV